MQPKKVKKKAKKKQPVQILEFAGVCLVMLICIAMPLKIVHIFSGFLGNMLYFLVPKRRNIAVENLRHAFREEKNELEIRKIARKSCKSFFLTFLEMMKFRNLLRKPDKINNFKTRIINLDEFASKIKSIHDKSGGCIFVTPHIGNWELLPYIFSMFEVPLTIVARPPDNVYIEKLIYSSRVASGQMVIPKKNALFALQRVLRQGTSIGLLPDQSTMKGISVNFFDRKATNTPVPALLAITYKRPIVVVACCRKAGNYQYECLVCDPIWPALNRNGKEPGENKDRKTEIFRLTEAMNQNMESIIKKYPGQYLWMHNRWKTYKGKKEFLS